MLYDCFIFFNELELLEIRLNELDSIVDKFVLVEATKTHTDKPKELIFEQNKEKFSKFLDKIIHIVVDDFPKGTPLDLEIYQRNAIQRGLINAKPEDIILVSDVDEIPRPEVVLQVKDMSGIKTLEQNFYYYYLNVLNKSPWLHGTKVLFYKDFTTAQEIRMSSHIPLIKNGGWHFSYFGGMEQIKLKIQSFHHQEFNKSKYTDLKKIEKRMRNNKDVFERKGYKNKTVPIDDTYPKYIINHLDKFKHFIKPQKINFLKNIFNKFK